MSKLVVSEFITLDGVIEAPETWSFPFFDEGVGTLKSEELLATGAHLLGRITYEGFAAAWPSRTDEQGFAERMNSLPKYVVSTTLASADWNNSHIIRDVADEVTKLKQQTREDILVAGSATLVQTLVENDLIDEYRLLVFPVVLGSGKRLFSGVGEQIKLNLLEAKSFGSGVVLQRYATERAMPAQREM